MKQILTQVMLTGISWIVLSLSLALSSADESITELATKANAAIRAGDNATGIQLIRQAITQGGNNSHLSYNLAIAYSRQGDVDIARELFSQVAGAGNPELAAKARYNLGNSDYSVAIQKLKQDPTAAREQLKSAIQNYRAALHINPSDADARANIELANRLIDRLRDDQKQDQSKQDQSKQDQSKQDQSKQDQSKQDQSKQDQSKQDQSKQDQSKQDQSKQDQSKQDQSKQDQSKQDQSKQDQSKQDQSKQDQSSDEQSDQTQESSQTSGSKQKPEPTESANQRPDFSSESNSPDTKKSDTEQESPSKSESSPDTATSKNAGTAPPAGELKPLNEPSTQKTEPTSLSGTAETLTDEQTMTLQEAQKMLQAVRDRELRRRLQQLGRAQSGRQRVEKDW